MFNLGGEDKEKLKQNMEEIKEMVSSDQQERMNEPQDSQQTQPENDSLAEPQDVEAEPADMSLDQIEDVGTDSDLGEEEPVSKGQDLDETKEAVESLRKAVGDSQSSSQRQSRRSQEHESSIASKEERTVERSNRLFLEVDEFDRVKEMVDEMRYLSRELGDLMSDLEGGIDEDRRIESEAQEVVEEFSSRREHVQGSIN